MEGVVETSVDLYLPADTAAGEIAEAAPDAAARRDPDRRGAQGLADSGLPDRARSESIFGALVDSGSLALATFDDGAIRFASPGFLRLLGLGSPDGETATSWCRRLHRADRERVSALLMDAISNSKALATECLITQPGGEAIKAHLAGYPAGPLSRGVFTLLLHVDVQGRNPLPAPRLPAPVRRAFAGGKSAVLDRTSDLLVDAWLTSETLAVLAVGLDAAGRALGEAARFDAEEALLAQLRACLRDGDAIGRVGDKGLLIAIPKVGGPASAGIVAGRLIDAIGLVRGVADEAPPGVNIGIALFPDDDQEMSGLLAHAGAALEFARQAGPNRYSLAETSLNHTLRQPARPAQGSAKVGLPDMDVQHGQLQEALQAAWRDVGAGADAPTAQAAIARLRDALMAEFRLEESIMEAHPAQDGAAHRKDHERALRNIDHLQRADVHQALALSLQFLAQWMPGHVREHDTPLVISTYRPLW